MVATLDSLPALHDLPSAQAFSWRACRLFGVPVRVHATYALPLVLPLAQLLWDTAFQPSAAALAYTVLWGLLLVGTTLVHELGHAFAARRVGCKVHEIILWPLGGLTSKDPAASPGDDRFIAACGPISHIPQALLCVAVMALCPRPVGWTLLRLLRELVLLGTTAWQLNLPGSFALQLAASACQVNLWLLLANLLPALPLDGSSILKDTLLLRGWSVERTATWLAFISLVVVQVAGPNMLSYMWLWCLYETGKLLLCVVIGNQRAHPYFVFSSAHWERRLAAKARKQRGDSATDEAPGGAAYRSRSASEDFVPFDGAGRKLGGRSSADAARRRWAAMGQQE